MDTSVGDGKIDWYKAASMNVEGCFHKTTAGNDYIDPVYEKNWADSKAYMKRGIYHWYTPFIDPILQAEWFLKKSHFDGELEIAVDLEDKRSVPRDIAVKVHKFIDHVQARTQLPVMIYTSPSWWTTYMMRTGAEAWWAVDCKLWIANWNLNAPNIPRPWSPMGWDYWQYGLVYGPMYGVEAKSLDMSIAIPPICALCTI